VAEKAMNAIRGWKAVASGTLLLLFSFSSAAQNRSSISTSPRDPLSAVAAPSAALQPSSEEQLFFREANAERTARGLTAYKWDETLAAAARKHASLMAKTEELSHHLAGEPPLDERAAQAGARFSSVGENIAIGPETLSIHDDWMRSPGHRANILNERFTALGVGVVEEKGEFYAVEDFSTAVENFNIEQQEQKVAALLSARGFHVTGDRTEARRFCANSHALTEHRSLTVFHLEVPDLGALPKEIERSLESTQYKQAAVGACEPQHAERGIPRFRIALLLY
jgi:uncharacterized protein YkwD